MCPGHKTRETPKKQGTAPHFPRGFENLEEWQALRGSNLCDGTENPASQTHE